ncbi:hypothetical protein ACEPAH_5206 [Sanghuangporus vaninii]
MDAPYSSSMCEGCCREGVETCPPHRLRKNHRKQVQDISDHKELPIPAEANVIPSVPDTIGAMNKVTTDPGYAELPGAQGFSQSNSTGMYSNVFAQFGMNEGVESGSPGPYSNQEGTSPLAMPFEGLYGLLPPNNDSPWYSSFANGNMGEASGANEDND